MDTITTPTKTPRNHQPDTQTPYTHPGAACPFSDDVPGICPNRHPHSTHHRHAPETATGGRGAAPEAARDFPPRVASTLSDQNTTEAYTTPDQASTTYRDIPEEVGPDMRDAHAVLACAALIELFDRGADPLYSMAMALRHARKAMGGESRE